MATSRDDRRTLFLHLGPHKTGTTYIQKLLTAARAELEAQGLTYPAPANGDDAHHALAQELLRGPGEETRRLAAVIDAFEGDALLSSENLSRLDAEGLAWFRSALPAHRLVAIHFIRARGGSLYSLWQEDVKHGADTGLVEYVAHVLCRPYGDRVINPQLLVDLYQPHVDDFKIVVYDNVLLAQQNIFDVLVGSCLARDVPGDLRRPGRVNRSLDPVRVEIIRMLNYLHLRRGGKRNHFLRDRFLKRSGHVAEVSEFVDAARVRLEGRTRSLPLGSLGTVFTHLDRELMLRVGPNVVNAAGDSLFEGELERRYEYFVPEEVLEQLGGWSELERLYAAVN